MSAKSILIIRKHLAHLIGMKLYELHFAGNMAMWGFSSCSSSIRFHTQSSYRMTYENQTILCMNDFYTPVRQGKNSTLLHTERDLLAFYSFPLKVISVDLRDNQDVTIEFENGFSLFIYADCNSRHEQWRFWEKLFQPHRTEHIFIAIDGTVRMCKYTSGKS